MQLGLILSIGLIIACNTYAQDSSNQSFAYRFFDAQYGLDTEIYKGRKYVNLTRYQTGSPFFGITGSEIIPFHTGPIRLDSKLISHVKLAYDVYNQEVLIRSKSLSGLSNDIILLNSLIDEFWIEGHHFIKNPFEDIDALYIERIEAYNSEIACLFSYYKEYRLQENSGVGEVGFGELRTRKYLLVNDIVHDFRTKRSFLKYLLKEDRVIAMTYIKSVPVKFKNGDSAYFETMLETLSKKSVGDD